MITLPKIDAIRAGAAALTHAESPFEIRVCRKADCLAERTHFVATQQQPVVLRKDKKTHKDTLHQLPASGVSESALGYMLDFKLFQQTGYFAPLDINDERIQIAPRWRSFRSVVAMANALTRELARRAASGDDTPISADTLMRKPSEAFSADMAKATSLGGKAAGSYAVRLDCLQQIMADYVICGAVLAPIDAGLRGATRAYKINAAWQPALREAYAMHIAADASPAADSEAPAADDAAAVQEAA